MLQKANSNKIKLAKYLLVFPLLCGMLFYTSCQESKEKTAEGETEVMAKVNELADAIMKKGKLNDEEIKALKFLAMESKEGDSIYLSVQSYLDDPNARTESDYERNAKVSGVPFSKLDKSPIYPGCENKNEQETKQCFTEKVATFVVENYPKKELNKSGVTGKYKVIVEFVIDEFGYLGDLNVRTNNSYLNAATMSVFEKFPALTPAKHQGKDVAVFYTLPILVDLDE